MDINNIIWALMDTMVVLWDLRWRCQRWRCGTLAPCFTCCPLVQCWYPTMP